MAAERLRRDYSPLLAIAYAQIASMAKDFKLRFHLQVILSNGTERISGLLVLPSEILEKGDFELGNISGGETTEFVPNSQYFTPCEQSQ